MTTFFGINVVVVTRVHCIEGVQEEPQSQNIAYQWHQEEQPTTQGSNQRKANQQLHIPQRGDHSARQDPSNTIIRQ